MAEAVGLVVYIIMIMVAVAKDVKHIDSRYGTPEELETLQEQIKGFSCLIHSVQG